LENPIVRTEKHDIYQTDAVQNIVYKNERHDC